MVSPGGLFAEAFACAGLDTLPVSAIALQASTVLFLDCQRILNGCPHACSFHGRLVHNLLQGIAQKNLTLTRVYGAEPVTMEDLEVWIDVFCNKIKPFICMSQKTTREKLMAFLLDQAKQQGSPEFVIPYDRQALADYLGVERSAMSVEIGKLKRAGRIDSKGSWFRVLNPDKGV